MPLLRRLGKLAGALTLVVGVLHFVVGLQGYSWSMDALWFFGAGMGVLLAGMLTMLAASPKAWRGLAVVALFGDALGLGLAIAFGALSDWREPQGPVLTLLFLGAAVGCIPALRST